MKTTLVCVSSFIGLLWSSHTLAEPLKQPDLVIDARVIDGLNDQALEDGRVIVRDGMIVCVGRKADCPAPQGAETIGGNLTVMPGLIDLHTHPKPHYLEYFLASGVTTIRTGNTSQIDYDLMLALGENQAEIVWSGPLLDGSNTIMRYFFENHDQADSPIRPLQNEDLSDIGVILAQTPEQAEMAMDNLAKKGLKWTKFYEQIPLEAFQAGVARAKQHGIKVMADLGMMSTRGLTGADVDLIQAAEAGISTLEHASGAALAYQRLGGDLSANTPDLELVDRMARVIVERDVTLVPTLAVYHAYPSIEAATTALAELPMGAAKGPVIEGLHQMWQRNHGIGRPETGLTDLDLVAPLVRRVIELGGKVALGSDTPAGAFNLPGGGVHKELEWLVGLGLSPMAAIKAATSNSAGVLGRPDIGAIEIGRRADLVLVRGKPDHDIAATREIVSVVRNGRWYDGASLAAQAEAKGNLLFEERFGSDKAD